MGTWGEFGVNLCSPFPYMTIVFNISWNEKNKGHFYDRQSVRPTRTTRPFVPCRKVSIGPRRETVRCGATSNPIRIYEQHTKINFLYSASILRNEALLITEEIPFELIRNNTSQNYKSPSILYNKPVLNKGRSKKQEKSL